ncbi:MAG: hypothetical protein KC588_14930, partial [Nitrospira sp.]|nr:hypothetical protein [Nitrospira sp.]
MNTYSRVMLSMVLGVMALYGPALAEPVLLQEGLGRHHFPISSNGAMAQRYFDQGLILSFGFNHAEAARSFKEAQRRDPNCAMCYWGEALVLGPNINAPMDPTVVSQAFAVLEKAVALKGQATEKEGALIQALAMRYSKEVMTDRSPLDVAYAEAMRAV